MPFLARKLLICAAVDGLILQPLSSRKDAPDQRTSIPYRIRYGEASIAPVSKDQLPDLNKPNTSFEAFGVVGESPTT